MLEEGNSLLWGMFEDATSEDFLEDFFDAFLGIMTGIPSYT